MTAEEIRAIELEVEQKPEGLYAPRINAHMFEMHREIAAQLAELNEKLGAALRQFGVTK